jgi:5-methylcytosine-specific restriction endonuclease McrA
VVFSAEGFTETDKMRRTGRYIPFQTEMRVVRRENYTCQHCNKHLQDNEVEFDHIIPFAKGESSDEHNIRLTCHGCNADKSNTVQI